MNRSHSRLNVFIFTFSSYFVSQSNNFSSEALCSYPGQTSGTNIQILKIKEELQSVGPAAIVHQEKFNSYLCRETQQVG